jgi:cobalt/nickel transport system permease protein
MIESAESLAGTGRELPRSGCSWMERADPRLRIVVAVVFALVVAMATRLSALGAALAATLLGVALSGLSVRVVLRRLLPLNVVMFLLLLVLPLTSGGTPLAGHGLGRFCFQEGLLLAAVIAIKGNAIVLALLVLLGATDVVTLGHALGHLRVPEKLAHLFLFTVRYLDVLEREYGRLRAAMTARGFRPRMNRHTYRSYGYLAGMLLVRSLDRSERIMAAMKCRGFQGRFYLLDHFAFSRRDVPFCVASLVVLTLLVLMEWA